MFSWIVIFSISITELIKDKSHLPQSVKIVISVHFLQSGQAVGTILHLVSQVPVVISVSLYNQQLDNIQKKQHENSQGGLNPCL
jgi:hypothetical protein